jgi:hypothetical protein
MTTHGYANRVEQLFVAWLGRSADGDELAAYSAEYAEIAANGRTFFDSTLYAHLLEECAYTDSTDYRGIVASMYESLTGEVVPDEVSDFFVRKLELGAWGVEKLAIKMLKGCGFWADPDGSFGTPPAFPYAFASVPNEHRETAHARNAERQAAREDSPGQGHGVAEYTDAEAATLLRLIQVEKLAGDLYEELAAQTDLPLFERLAHGEDQHMNALLRLAVKADIPLDNVQGLAKGEFSATGLQAIYDQWLLAGSVSAAAALDVGQAVEALSIEGLEAAMVEVVGTPLWRTCDQLLDGSERHLAAVEDCLQA